MQQDDEVYEKPYESEACKGEMKILYQPCFLQPDGNPEAAYGYRKNQKVNIGSYEKIAEWRVEDICRRIFNYAQGRACKYERQDRRNKARGYFYLQVFREA